MKLRVDRKVNVLRIVNKQDDGIGGISGVESILHYQLPCYIAPSRGTEGAVFKKETHHKSHTMVCGIVDLQETDIVVSGTIRYEVLDVDNAKGQFLTVSLSLVR